GDLICLYLGLILALVVRYMQWPPRDLGWLTAPMGSLFLLGAIIMFIVGLYDLGQAKNSWNFYKKVLISTVVWTALSIIYFYINPRLSGPTPKTILLLNTFFGFGLLALWRAVYNKFVSAEILKTKIIFAGVMPETLELIKLIKKEPQRGYETAGIIVGPGEVLPEEFAGIPHNANFAALGSASKEVGLIVVSPLLAADKELAKELYSELFHQITIMTLAKLYEQLMGRIPPFTFSEAWFLNNLNEQQKKIYDRFRIILDCLGAVILGAFFIITFPLVALAIKLSSPGPLFLIHERVGRMGQTFKIYKYRSMKALKDDGSAETDGPQFTALNDNRITPVGKFLRRTRLDEVPQFINILKNEMGLIGPRPERPEFVAQLTAVMPFYSLRHVIKPGLTGWAQIHSSYYGTLDENLRKLEYDLFYIKNRGPLSDLAIVLRTINILIRMIGR
ncbi:MAG: exopolysaccharide biosynthesis polyprenyl glycosylphosphotransferase, partial [Candidatus Komeilibacteria bacterium]|nr:exopolysaccharide biosynthesis polyprenyl glycosylphosphotransferase [Candidatus Komeilibacteria bacterium]